MNPIIIGELKRGETFSVNILLKNAFGEPLDLDVASNSLTAEIRKESGDTLVTATVTKTAELGVYKVSYSGSTSSWPLEIVYTDIRAVIGGDVVKSKPTVGVSIVRDETRG